MRRSSERILTTHTGSLRKPDDLAELFRRRETRTLTEFEQAQFPERVRQATQEMVQKQLAVGLDIVNDGEVGKTSWVSYVFERMTGFERRPGAEILHRRASWTPAAGLVRPRAGWMATNDLPDAPGHDRPDIAEFHGQARRTATNPEGLAWVCVGPIAAKEPEAAQVDIANLQAAVADQRFTEVFMTALSPGHVARNSRNEYYRDEETLMEAVAEGLRTEYEAIARAGFVLQLDAPDLAAGANGAYARLSTEEFRKVITLHVEALNWAVRNIPKEQVRIHICWGNYEGPHHRDIPLRDIIDIAFKAHAAGFSIEGANPRHGHEYHVFEKIQLPPGTVLIPGVIDDKTSFVEHPELVAERILHYARLVGRENVIAAPDCGFGGGRVDADIVWAKLNAMVEGAQLATRELWGQRAMA